MWTVSHQLILVITALTLKTDAASHMVDGSGDDGIGSGIDQIDIDFWIKILALEPSQFTIYWLHPDTTSDVSYYQVSYNVTVHYQTTAGQKTFNDSRTLNQLSSNRHTIDIPLYIANSTYTIQVVAVTDDGDIINSEVLIVSEDTLERVEDNDSMNLFQLGLKAHATFDCQSFKYDYDSILLLIRSQVVEAVQHICNVSHNGNETCTTEFANDQFSCHNNSGLVYIARVVSIMHTSTTTFLQYLKMLGAFEISLNDRIFSVVSSPYCPLSIPSAEEINCTVGLVSDNVTDTTTTTARATKISNDIVMVTVVALSCFVGIIVMTLCIAGVMFLCSRCNSYHGDIESIDLDGEEQCKDKNNSPPSSQQLQDSTLNIPSLDLAIPPNQFTQQFNFSGAHGNFLPSSYLNNHHGNQNANNLHTTSL